MMSAGDKRRMGLVPPQGAGCTLNGTLQRLIMIRSPRMICRGFCCTVAAGLLLRVRLIS